MQAPAVDRVEEPAQDECAIPGAECDSSDADVDEEDRPVPLVDEPVDETPIENSRSPERAADGAPGDGGDRGDDEDDGDGDTTEPAATPTD